MWNRGVEERWQREADEVSTGMPEGRSQHPRATFQEIERALDEKLARVRARMLQDLALASQAARVSEEEPSERPKCPKCGGPLEARGEQTRTLLTNYNQPIELTRSYAYCPACQAGLFPPR